MSVPKTVWVLMRNDYDQTDVWAVYSTEALARTAADRENAAEKALKPWDKTAGTAYEPKPFVLDAD